jgi:drug/metabolite transporter (DMT)-like permease
VPADALALALGAAFLHAFWNVLIARAKDPEAATAVALLVALVAYAPVAVVTWRLEPAAIPYIVVTSFLQLGYVILLAAAYVRAELSVVYPIARGTAPVLVLVVGVVALGLGSSTQQAAGVCLVGVGVLLVRGLRRTAEPAGVLFGLAIACFIAAYTLVDKYGIRYAAPFVYLELSMLLSGLGYSAAILRLRGRPALRAEFGRATVAAGLATFGA